MNAAATSQSGTQSGHSNWRVVARRLSSEPGWVPPAFMIGAAFLIVALNFLIGLLVPAAWANTIGLTTLFTWLAVGVLATLRVAGRALYALIRLGIMGFVRPRWWFEVGRLNVIALLFGLLSMMVLFFLWRNGVIARHDELYTALWIGATITAVMSFALFAVGYALSLLLRLPRRGRAFDCVYFFTTVIGGLLLMKWALDLWDRQQQLPGMVAAILVGLIGLAVFYTGFLSSVGKFQRQRRRDA